MMFASENQEIKVIQPDTLPLLILRSAKKYLKALNVIAPFSGQIDVTDLHSLVEPTSRSKINLKKLQQDFQGREENTDGLQSGLSGEALCLLVASKIIDDVNVDVFKEKIFEDITPENLESFKKTSQEFLLKTIDLVIVSVLTAIAHAHNSFAGRRMVSVVLNSFGQTDLFRIIAEEKLGKLGVLDKDRPKPISVKKGQTLLKQYLSEHPNLEDDIPEETLKFA